jgi:hypothetical protein
MLHGIEANSWPALQNLLRKDMAQVATVYSSAENRKLYESKNSWLKIDLESLLYIWIHGFVGRPFDYNRLLRLPGDAHP